MDNGIPSTQWWTPEPTPSPTASVAESISAVSASLSESISGSASASASGHSLVSQSNPAFKVVGVCLAVGSGLFIGVSFVIKKKGLLSSTAKSGNAAGEGHAYLKSPMWWTGMTLMVIGEILNFVAYAFTVAILVTAMGSISVVVAAILSHFILKETLTFFGWIGCALCVLGSIILALNAPQEQSVRTIKEFMKYFVSPGFLVWAGLCIAVSLVIVFYVAPRWGKKNMMPYISVCSLIGGISVSCTQGLGSAIITSIQGENQVKHWFFWFLFFFVVITLLIEINYLNKALELFNTSMVVPVYFCYFTSATMVTSFILYRGLKASAVSLVTMILGFLVTCLGITLLQMSKVDPKQLQGLDRRSTMLLAASRHGTESQEKGETTAIEEPGMDALRGGFGAVGSIIRARTVTRRMSDASGKQGGRGGSADSNSYDLNNLPRYRLQDNPLREEDDMERVSLTPTTGGDSLRSDWTAPPRSPGAVPPRSPSALKFGAQDIVHQYGYTQHEGHTDAMHSVRDADVRSRADLRQYSGSTIRSMEPVIEGASDESRGGIIPRSTSPEAMHDRLASPPPPGFSEYDPGHGEKTSFSQLLGSITHSPSLRINTSVRSNSPHSTRSPRHAGSPRDQVRGGPARGMKDYPHLKNDADKEHEERKALVSDGSDTEEGHHMSDDGHTLMTDEGQTFMTMESIGEIRTVTGVGMAGTPPTVRRPLPPKPEGRRPMGPR